MALFFNQIEPCLKVGVWEQLAACHILPFPKSALCLINTYSVFDSLAMLSTGCSHPPVLRVGCGRHQTMAEESGLCPNCASSSTALHPVSYPGCHLLNGFCILRLFIRLTVVHTVAASYNAKRLSPADAKGSKPWCDDSFYGCRHW
jgi:hypothetical protein